MKQHMCSDCFKSLCHCGVWGGQQAEPPQASPDKPRAPCPIATLLADRTGRASPVSCLQAMFSADWRAAGLCQTPSGSNKRGSSGQWVWHTQHHHLIPKTSPHLPSMSFLRHHQPVAGSPEPEAPLHPCPGAAHGKQRIHMVAQRKGWVFGGAALQTATVSHGRTTHASPALVAFTPAWPLPSCLCVLDTAQVLASVQVNGLILLVV